MSEKPNQFKLNVATRLMLLMNLPEQGSVVDMISKRNVRKKIDFSSEEVEKLSIKNDDGRLTWNNETEPINVNFTESEVVFLKKIIDKLDQEGYITDSILDFVELINK